MSVNQVSRGKWKVVINLGHINGKRARRVYYVDGTRKDADRFERAKLAERDNGRLPKDGSATMRQLAADFMSLRADQYSPTTAARYQSLFDHHILPTLGDQRLAKISPRDIEGLFKALAKSGHRRLKRGLSPQTILHVYVLLQALFKYARREQFISNSPMLEIDRPKVPKKRRKVVEADKLAGFMIALQRSKYRVPIILAVSTGLRRGEVLGLRWSDVDLDAGNLTVRQTIVEDESKALHVKPPKSEAGNRTIALSASTVALLREHKRDQAELTLMIGRDYRRDLDLVCAGPAGEFMRPARLTTAYRGLAAAHGLQGVGLHDLRHTHATWLLESGVDLKTISGRLGHSTIALTANTYAHVTEKLDRDAADRFDHYLGGNEGTK